MKITTERRENCIVALNIQVDEKETDNYLQGAARTLAREYRVPGFRPGKAPYSVVLRRFGVEAVRGQAVDQFGDQIFEQGLKESGLVPVAQATLENVTWEPMTLHLQVPVAPEVNLGAYRDIRVGWEEIQITDEEFEEALANLRKEHAEWEKVERPTALGDQVVIDITGTVDGKVVLSNTDRETVLNADSPYPVPGFATQVVGMTPGETREFDLTYPEDHYNPDTAGKSAHFEARLHEIKVQNLPELNDEFATLVGDYENLQDLKVKLRQSLLERKQTQAKEEHLEQIWSQLLSTAQVEYPKAYLDREIEAMKEQLSRQLQQRGSDLDTFFKLTNTTEEAWKGEITPRAQDRLKRQLILGKIVELEKITVEQAETDAEIAKIVEPLGDQGSNLREWLNSPTGAMTVTENVMADKATERLLAIARGQAPALEEAKESTAESAELEAGQPQTEGASTPAAAETQVEAISGQAAGEAAVEPAAPELAAPELAAPEPSGEAEGTPKEEE